ncbi:ribonuclease H-like domain-containing protein [Brevibacillus laterosporus]|uniref:Ribonuclease H-like domain-containing protein n=1 Tax=Brevibacillus laterosporus TaxID=1465 RepID=A0AAP3DF91_BRELA|nr:ribonuclease H-like domain-containing protein [Brevibacillus laterosporus]MCR8979806.1 ribonuclease H-like domain-containing protein [Brevibacillus laterosporus]MCZ0806961.1 ribonuclease H-like domain-containing protein [Brevibacillus laterosporus]MCZ0825236.1 ribonuclease H-like domain-containing protein [Brevibacillus laterosporus]MCZ0849947.1 ribonuclease H-like domain-containing protein [Brevibacillus laterosporus]
MSLKNKLQRMKKHLTLDSSIEHMDQKEKRAEPEKQSEISEVNSQKPEEFECKQSVHETPQSQIPYADTWRRLQAKPFFGEEEYAMVREVRYPLDMIHGNYEFSALLDVIHKWNESGLEHPLSIANKRPEDLLFFDTETTGLHGGVGNTIFLLGYSKLEQDEIIVRQHFLTDPFSEITLYQSFLADVKESKQLVTYNGKSFDWPQVKTRHTLVRKDVPALPVFGHIDLLHGARRLWKNELVSCRLSIVEQQKLGIRRLEDVPGSLAPMLYFDYVRERNPEHIAGVLQHNEVDVLSLITLYIHISNMLLSVETVTMSMEERYEVARWYEAVGSEHMALSHYREVARSKHPYAVRAKAALGHIFKRQKEWSKALYCYDACMKDKEWGTEEICIEAAKICEHHLKEYDKAYAYTKLAFERWQKKTAYLRQRNKAEREMYEKRLLRLEKKLGQTSESLFVEDVTK